MVCLQHLLGIKRRDFAEKMGVAPSTVSNYSWGYGPKKYYEKGFRYLKMRLEIEQANYLPCRHCQKGDNLRTEADLEEELRSVETIRVSTKKRGEK